MVSHVPLFVTAWTTARLFLSWHSPGKNTEVGCYFLSQEIFPAPGMEPVTPVSHGLLARFYTIVPPGMPSNFLKTLQNTRQPFSWSLCLLVMWFFFFFQTGWVEDEGSRTWPACISGALLPSWGNCLKTSKTYNFLAFTPKVIEEHTCGDLEKAWTQAPSFFSMALQDSWTLVESWCTVWGVRG